MSTLLTFSMPWDTPRTTTTMHSTRKPRPHSRGSTGRALKVEK